MSQEVEREFGWEDTIEKDSNFVILPEGDYDFIVTKFERGRFNGSAKMPACNQAKVELTFKSDQGDVIIIHTLLLHTKTEGLLSNFFAGIGQKRKGEKLKMNWNTVVGSRGRAKLFIDTYKNYTGNKVDTFYPYEEVFGQAPQQQYQQNQYQQPPQNQQQYPPQYPQTPPPQQQGYQQPFPGAGAPPQQGGGWSQGNF